MAIGKGKGSGRSASSLISRICSFYILFVHLSHSPIHSRFSDRLESMVTVGRYRIVPHLSFLSSKSVLRVFPLDQSTKSVPIRSTNTCFFTVLRAVDLPSSRTLLISPSLSLAIVCMDHWVCFHSAIVHFSHLAAVFHLNIAYFCVAKVGQEGKDWELRRQSAEKKKMGKDDELPLITSPPSPSNRGKHGKREDLQV